MSFIDKIKERAKNDIKTIVLPEATDIRILEATSIILKDKFAHIVLIGDKEEINQKAKEANIDILNAQIIDPKKSEKFEEYANTLYELRKNKGMTIEQAKKLVLNPVYYGMIMLKNGEADGLVSGAIHSIYALSLSALSFIIKSGP